MTGHIRATVRALRSRQGREAGSVALFVAAIGAALVLGGGLIWDASGKIEAYRHAQTTAQEAARAAAQALNGGAIAGNGGQADPYRAIAAGQAYLTAAGEAGSITADGVTLTVTTSEPWRGHFLRGGGTATGTASVRITPNQ